MRDIARLSVDMSHFSNNLIQKIAEKEELVAKKVHRDIVSGAPVRTGKYKDSIILEPTKIFKDRIVTSISSDLMVGGNSPKWKFYRLAVFIEHGTGPKGQSSYNGRHSPVYRQTPWAYYDDYLGQLIYTYGLSATMHWQKGLDANTEFFKEQITVAIKEARH